MPMLLSVLRSLAPLAARELAIRIHITSEVNVLRIARRPCGQFWPDGHHSAQKAHLSGSQQLVITG